MTKNMKLSEGLNMVCPFMNRSIIHPDMPKVIYCWGDNCMAWMDDGIIFEGYDNEISTGHCKLIPKE